LLFFFEKKNQKTFMLALRADVSTKRKERPANESEPNIKIFRFPFLKGNKKK